MVWRAARQLHDALAGQVLTSSDFRVPRYATTDLTGRRVIEAVARGKHLLTRVDGGVTVHTHLRMDGSWRIRPAGGYPPRDHRVRLILANERWQAIGYQLGVVEVLATAREDRAVGHLGPDLLGPDWDADEAVRRLRAAARPAGGRGAAGPAQPGRHREPVQGRDAVPARGQPVAAGRRHRRPAGVVELARRLLDANKERIGQVTTGNPARGAETWVYGRAGRPCRRCGTVIRQADQGPATQERVTFWCPACQPA